MPIWIFLKVNVFFSSPYKSPRPLLTVFSQLYSYSVSYSYPIHFHWQVMRNINCKQGFNYVLGNKVPEKLVWGFGLLLSYLIKYLRDRSLVIKGRYIKSNWTSVTLCIWIFFLYQLKWPNCSNRVFSLCTMSFILCWQSRKKKRNKPRFLLIMILQKGQRKQV